MRPPTRRPHEGPRRAPAGAPALAPEDGLPRCRWPGRDALYVRYHDEEWGVPVHDDAAHFEQIALSVFQAGLNFLMVLRRREQLRAAFAGFDPRLVADFDDDRLVEIRELPGVIRNVAKIRAVRTNARAMVGIAREFGSFDAFAWGFVDGRPVVNQEPDESRIACWDARSDALSAELRRRGFAFTGTKMAYAYMQAVGLLNDHAPHCFCWRALQADA